MHMSKKETLLSYSLAILKDGDFHDELAPAITNYATLLFSLAQLDQAAESQRNHMSTDNGSAIGTYWAAQCVKEIFRTQRFVKGLNAAIDDVKKANSGKTVQVLYAGTGPFAALALPIMATHLPTDVQFTLLEINPESYAKLLHVLTELEFNEYVNHLEIADASSWQTDQHFDIVLSETMNRALIKEPQVSIMLNLASQLQANTIFIPQEIKVLVSAKRPNEANKTNIAQLISFNSAFMLQLIRKNPDRKWDFETHEVQFDPNDRLYFETEIIVYDQYKLVGNDCSLNFSEPIRLAPNNKSEKISFKYTTNSKPGFEYVLLCPKS